MSERPFMRRRKFIGVATAGTIAVVAGVAGSARANSDQAARNSVSKDCAGASDYTPDAVPGSATVGSNFVISGALPILGSDGEVEGSTTTHVEAWWNLDPDEWWSAYSDDPPVSEQPGEVIKLGATDTAGECSYSITATVPDVPQGTYSVVVLYSNGESIASFEAVAFENLG